MQRKKAFESCTFLLQQRTAQFNCFFDSCGQNAFAPIRKTNHAAFDGILPAHVVDAFYDQRLPLAGQGERKRESVIGP